MSPPYLFESCLPQPAAEAHLSADILVYSDPTSFSNSRRLFIMSPPEFPGLDNVVAKLNHAVSDVRTVRIGPLFASINSRNPTQLSENIQSTPHSQTW